MNGDSCLLPSSSKEAEARSQTTSVKEEKQVPLMGGSHLWLCIRITWELKVPAPGHAPNEVRVSGGGISLSSYVICVYSRLSTTAMKAPRPPAGAIL